MAIPARTAEETARLGDKIYERDIRPLLEETCHGKIVAIDVASGSYAVGDTVSAASKRLRERCPDADVWSVRIGYRALVSFGGRPLRRAFPHRLPEPDAAFSRGCYPAVPRSR